MMRSKFAVVVIVLYASAMLAQHSSGGGGGGSSSASSGGGSHSGGYSGGSTSSATSTSHSSGGSGGSSSHSSTSGSAISHSAMHGTQSNPAHFIHTPNVLTETKTPQSEKKGLLSFLRHPFKKPEPRPVNNLRHWLCGKGPCPICPSGQSNGKGACIAPLVATRNQTLCPSGDLWNGGACILQTHHLAVSLYQFSTSC